MKRAIPGLLLLLLAQLALVALVYQSELNPLSSGAAPSTTALDAALVDGIAISGSEGAQASLKKIGDRWQLPALHDLPADREKVASLLDALLVNGNDWPVASSAAARQRFKVADYLYQRKIDLSVGKEQLQTVFLGTSPGFRKVHARVAGVDEVRSMTFNLHDAPASDSAWIDPSLLQVRTPMRIDADAYSVHREGGEWLSGLGGTPDPRELLALLTALRTLQVDGVADAGTAADLAESEAELVLDIDSLSGPVLLSFWQKDGRYFVRSSEFPVVFRISAYTFERIVGIDFLLISGQGEAQ